MTPIEQQAQALRAVCPNAVVTPLSSGGHLVEIPDYPLPAGWDRESTTIVFWVPPGYPASQPDCFWMDPGNVRLQSGTTPQGTSEANPVPGLGPRGTWFSWHVQAWNPNHDSLLTYLNVIKQRLSPPR